MQEPAEGFWWHSINYLSLSILASIFNTGVEICSCVLKEVHNNNTAVNHTTTLCLQKTAPTYFLLVKYEYELISITGSLRTPKRSCQTWKRAYHFYSARCRRCMHAAVRQVQAPLYGLLPLLLLPPLLCISNLMIKN